MRAKCCYTCNMHPIYILQWFTSGTSWMPEDCMIDDTVDFKCENEEDDGDNTSHAILRTPLPHENNLNRTALRNSNSQSKSARKEIGIGSILEKMTQGREEVNGSMNKILEIMRSAGSSRGGDPHEIIDQINKSMTLIRTCRNELKDLCRRKRAMKRGIWSGL